MLSFSSWYQWFGRQHHRCCGWLGSCEQYLLPSVGYCMHCEARVANAIVPLFSVNMHSATTQLSHKHSHPYRINAGHYVWRTYAPPHVLTPKPNARTHVHAHTHAQKRESHTQVIYRRCLFSWLLLFCSNAYVYVKLTNLDVLGSNFGTTAYNATTTWERVTFYNLNLGPSSALKMVGGRPNEVIRSK